MAVVIFGSSPRPEGQVRLAPCGWSKLPRCPQGFPAFPSGSWLGKVLEDPKFWCHPCGAKKSRAGPGGCFGEPRLYLSQGTGPGDQDAGEGVALGHLWGSWSSPQWDQRHLVACTRLCPSESCLPPPGAAIGLHGTESPSNEWINKSYKAVRDLLDFNIREIMRAFLLACNITGPNRITTRVYPRAFPWRWAGFQLRG